VFCVNEHEAATLGRALDIDANEPETIGAALARRRGVADSRRRDRPAAGLSAHSLSPLAGRARG